MGGFVIIKLNETRDLWHGSTTIYELCMTLHIVNLQSNKFSTMLSTFSIPI